MSEEEQLQQLLVFASSEDRICPQPGKWDAIWRLLGQPRGDLGPLDIIGVGILDGS